MESTVQILCSNTTASWDELYLQKSAELLRVPLFKNLHHPPLAPQQTHILEINEKNNKGSSFPMLALRATYINSSHNLFFFFGMLNYLDTL